MKKKIIVPDEQGFALVIGLLILVVLTVIGTIALRTTSLELSISGNDQRQKKAFYAAEAGIEMGRAALNALKEEDTGYWDLVLSGSDIDLSAITGNATDSAATCDAENATCLADTDGHVDSVDPNDVLFDDFIDLMGSRTLLNNDSAEFYLLVRDNDDLDGSDVVDTDNTLVLTSIGTYGDAVARIETVVRYIGKDQYAQEYYNTESTNRADGSGDVANSKRW